MKRTMLLLVAALLGACELSDPIANSDLDAWCGDVPCGWEVDGGEIKRVSTWHSHDYAVSFESDGARLSQVSSDEYYAYPCLAFTMLARVAPGAKAYVELDFLNDGGEPEWHKQIPASDFQPLSFYVKAPEWYDVVRFIVRKESGGEVVLAKLRVEYADGTKCAGLDPVEIDHLPGGAPCDDHDQCAFGECRSGHCVGCMSDDDCEDGEVCGYKTVYSGLGSTPLNVMPACIDPGERNTGALCLGDGECESGVCCDGVCSECCGSGSCGGDAECAPSVAPVDDDHNVAVPYQCAPGEMQGEQGEVCSDDADCRSGSCGSRQCTGLCGSIGALIGESCAMLDCDSVDFCSELTCAVETIEVGRCD